MTTQQLSLGSITLPQRLTAGLVTLTLGLGLLIGIGFAGPTVLHNAAHDTRHSIGFPCH